MTEYRRTWEITNIDWNKVFRAYEALFDCEIDPAVDERGEFYRTNYKTWDRRHRACTVYYHGVNDRGRIEELFRDELLSRLGIYLGYEEVEG
jgi:hypothetical protein